MNSGASGVVLVTEEQAQPYLKYGRTLLAGSFALIVLDSVASPISSYLHHQFRAFVGQCNHSLDRYHSSYQGSPG